MKNCDQETSHPEGAQRLRELPGSNIIADMENSRYTVYILTNKHKNVLYIGVTSKLKQRLCEHKDGTRGWFTKKYKCYFLVYIMSILDI